VFALRCAFDIDLLSPLLRLLPGGPKGG
jgi:hypothetical protein